MMKARITMILRLLLGLIFVVFGLNGFFQFLAVPPPSGEAAKVFMGGLFQTGYFFPILALVQTLSGMILLSGFFVPLGLLILAPITVNIFFYHIFLDPANLLMAILVVALNIYLGWAYKDYFTGALEMRTNLDSGAKG